MKRYQEKSMLDMLLYAKENHGDVAAIDDGDITITYEALYNEVFGLAAAFQSKVLIKLRAVGLRLPVKLLMHMKSSVFSF